MCLKIRLDGGCSARNCAPKGRDRVAVGFSQLKLSSKTTGNHCLNRILSGDRNLPADRSCAIAEIGFVPQASPQYGGLPILATANKRRISGDFSPCAFTDFSKSAPLLGIPLVSLLKFSATRPENASGCNGNGAPPDAHIRNSVTIDRRRARSVSGGDARMLPCRCWI
jgi:hypothetical protein